MKAIVRDRYGKSDVLKLADVDEPEIGDDQVLLRVHGSSINMGDRLVMQGTPYVMRMGWGLFGPKDRGLGHDVSGVVEAGSLAPAFESRTTLAELPEAMREIEQGVRRGKVLVTA